MQSLTQLTCTGSIVRSIRSILAFSSTIKHPRLTLQSAWETFPCTFSTSQHSSLYMHIQQQGRLVQHLLWLLHFQVSSGWNQITTLKFSDATHRRLQILRQQITKGTLWWCTNLSIYLWQDIVAVAEFTALVLNGGQKIPQTHVHLRIFGVVFNPNCEGGLQRLKVVDVASDDLKRGKGTSLSSILGKCWSWKSFSPGIKREEDGPTTW